MVKRLSDMTPEQAAYIREQNRVRYFRKKAGGSSEKRRARRHLQPAPPVIVLDDPNEEAGFPQGTVFDDRQEVSVMFQNGSWTEGTKIEDAKGRVYMVKGTSRQTWMLMEST
jgi:hypothetical protein